MVDRVEEPERFETVIIGGGQAGLAVAYHLKRMARPFVIFDMGETTGDSWRLRWDSLRLFTPARFSGLPGMEMPGPRSARPTKDEVADYLSAYALHFALPVRHGVRVDHLNRDADGFVIEVDGRSMHADKVIVATGAYHAPNVPSFATALDPAIVQLHSSDYHRPTDLPPGDVLVVGAGNSGAEISHEVSRRHRTWLSGRPTGEVPVRIDGVADRVLTPLIWLLATHLLTTDTPVGRRIRRDAVSVSAPLEGVKSKDLAAAGVERVPPTAGVRDGLPMLENGRVLDVSTVIWSTGFRPDFGWIDLPAFGPDGEPVHHRGVVDAVPGLYVVSRFFLYSFTSALIGGVGRDAEHIVRHICASSETTALVA